MADSTPPARAPRTPRELPKLRSPFARAVVPVAAGIVFFALLFGVTWLVAVAISGDEEGIRIGDAEFQVDRADFLAQMIRDEGPLLYADLKGRAGEQALILDHDPNALDVEGWSLYFAYRADTGPACLVEIDKVTRQLVDCQGQVVTTADLQPAEPAARVVVELGKRPVVKIQFQAAQVPTTVPTDSTP